MRAPIYLASKFQTNPDETILLNQIQPSAHLIYCCLLCQIVSHSMARAIQRWQTPDRVKVIHPTAAAVRPKTEKNEQYSHYPTPPPLTIKIHPEMAGRDYIDWFILPKWLILLVH